MALGRDARGCRSRRPARASRPGSGRGASSEGVDLDAVQLGDRGERVALADRVVREALAVAVVVLGPGVVPAERNRAPMASTVVRAAAIRTRRGGPARRVGSGTTGGTRGSGPTDGGVSVVSAMAPGWGGVLASVNAAAEEPPRGQRDPGARAGRRALDAPGSRLAGERRVPRNGDGGRLAGVAGARRRAAGRPCRPRCRGRTGRRRCRAGSSWSMSSGMMRLRPRSAAGSGRSGRAGRSAPRRWPRDPGPRLRPRQTMATA